jgi:hypothetical protein
MSHGFPQAVESERSDSRTSAAEPQHRMQLDPVGGHARLPMDLVPEPDALDPDVPSKRRERRGGERTAGVDHLSTSGPHPVPLEARGDAVGVGELDDHRAVPIGARCDHEMDVAVVFDLRLDHLRPYVVGPPLDPSQAWCGRVQASSESPGEATPREASAGATVHVAAGSPEQAGAVAFGARAGGPLPRPKFNLSRRTAGPTPSRETACREADPNK